MHPFLSITSYHLSNIYALFTRAPWFRILVPDTQLRPFQQSVYQIICLECENGLNLAALP
jgi:hypothetical protein